ncbi:MAG: DUF4381 family protein [Akkermansiaceae bacterium]
MFHHRLHFLISSSILFLAGGLSAQDEDIRGPRDLVKIPVPETTGDALWWGLAAGLLTVAIILFFWKRQKRRQQSKSPLSLALAGLTEIADTRGNLPAEAFANRAAQTVRQYIAAQFGIAAPRRTTEEFLNDLTKDEDSPLVRERDSLRGFLKSCDLAKFAGVNLSPKQREELLQAARGFVESSSAPIIPSKATST